MQKNLTILDYQLMNHKNDIIKAIKNNMVLIKGNTFIMGGDSDTEKDQKKHQVILSDFYINKYEVTRLEWMAVMVNQM